MERLTSADHGVRGSNPVVIYFSDFEEQLENTRELIQSREYVGKTEIVEA